MAKFTGTSGLVIVVDDAKYEEGQPLDPGVYDRAIALLSLAQHTDIVWDFPIPHETKYLTIVSSASISCLIVINYSLKKATQKDIIFEFVKKTKQ